jgi:hypothetical protein
MLLLLDICKNGDEFGYFCFVVKCAPAILLYLIDFVCLRLSESNHQHRSLVGVVEQEEKIETRTG